MSPLNCGEIGSLFVLSWLNYTGSQKTWVGSDYDDNLCGLCNCMWLQIDNKFDAAKAYVDASHCFNKTSRKGALIIEI